MWGARGSFLPAAAMVVMVVLGSWLIGHLSLQYRNCFYFQRNQFDFQSKYLDWSKFYSSCPDRADKILAILYLDQI